MSSRWYTSDLHLWHTNILKYCPERPWKTVEEMNEGLLRNWNAAVQPDDTVFCVGDFSMAFRPVELYTRRLNGYKTLILGNHDFAHGSHKKSRTPDAQAEWVRKYIQNGWHDVAQELMLTLSDGTKVRLNHLPYLEPDAEEDQRHARFRPVDDGTILLCGHIHQHWLTRRTGKGTLMVNVGVDRQPEHRPWSEAEIIRIIEENK